MPAKTANNHTGIQFKSVGGRLYPISPRWSIIKNGDIQCTRSGDKKFGDYYYIYSTDAIFAENRRQAADQNVPLGNIQIRRSKDLVHWEFVGWAFSEIPEEAVAWVHANNGGRGATNIWAPYVTKKGDKYRLYFSVSAFGKKTSWIGLAESDAPEGPWQQKGAVVKTNSDTPMNAIDPSVIEDVDNGKIWMHYGSYFGGLYCVELDPETGLTRRKDDLGHLIARRANYRKDNLEAPEIIYNPKLKKYFLFVSYDPLMTTYNIRVGQSDRPEGPFMDYFGKNLSDTTNNDPIIVAPYKFENHPGWAGTDIAVWLPRTMEDTSWHIRDVSLHTTNSWYCTSVNFSSHPKVGPLPHHKDMQAMKKGKSLKKRLQETGSWYGLRNRSMNDNLKQVRYCGEG